MGKQDIPGGCPPIPATSLIEPGLPCNLGTGHLDPDGVMVFRARSEGDGCCEEDGELTGFG